MQTSKAMVVGPSAAPNADVQMTFAQVSLKDASVDWASVCGNMTSAVAPFAINEGIVRAGKAADFRPHLQRQRR